MTHELVRALFAASANPAPTPWRIVTKMAFFIGLIGAFRGSLLHGLVLAPVLSRTSATPATALCFAGARPCCWAKSASGS